MVRVLLGAQAYFMLIDRQRMKMRHHASSFGRAASEPLVVPCHALGRKPAGPDLLDGLLNLLLRSDVTKEAEPRGSGVTRALGKNACITQHYASHLTPLPRALGKNDCIAQHYSSHRTWYAQFGAAGRPDRQRDGGRGLQRHDHRQDRLGRGRPLAAHHARLVLDLRPLPVLATRGRRLPRLGRLRREPLGGDPRRQQRAPHGARGRLEDRGHRRRTWGFDIIWTPSLVLSPPPAPPHPSRAVQHRFIGLSVCGSRSQAKDHSERTV